MYNFNVFYDYLFSHIHTIATIVIIALIVCVIIVVCAIAITEKDDKGVK
jgi:tryptophan-rich sensory protein